VRFGVTPGALLYTYILKFRIAVRAPLPQAERPDLAPGGAVRRRTSTFRLPF